MFDATRRAYTTDIKLRLKANAEELFCFLIGQRPTKRKKPRIYFHNRQSLAVHITGTRCGQWIDRESGQGGDIFKAIGFFGNIEDFAAQVDWAANWLELLPFDPEGITKIDSQRVQERLEAERKARQERVKEETAKEQAEVDKKREWALVIWNNSAPVINGSAGDIYLRNERKLPIVAYPPCVRWSPKYHALVFAITAEDGSINAIQLVAVTIDGKKNSEYVWFKNDLESKRAKNTFGSIGNGVFRLPGPSDGPLIICEGPETALSAWVAGYEVYAFIGPIRLDRVPSLAERGRKVVIGLDDDKNTNKNAKAIYERKRKIKKLCRDGYDVVGVKPFDKRREDKSDFNDLIIEHGVNGVRNRINKFISNGFPISRDFMPLNKAREKLEKVIEADMRSLISWERSDDSEFAPSLGYKITAGVGKTQAVIRAVKPILRDMRAKGDKRSIVIAIPFHDLGDDFKDRYAEQYSTQMQVLDAVEREAQNICSKEFSVRSYRGREARRPRSDELMCADIATVREAHTKRVLNITNEICKKECSFKSSCPYLAQKEQKADIWLVSHQSLFNKVPASIGADNVALVVVDETAWQSGVLPDSTIVVRTIVDMPLPSVIDTQDRDGDSAATLKRKRKRRMSVSPIHETERPYEFADMRNRLVKAIIANGEGPLRADILLSHGFALGAGKIGAERERDRTITEGNWRDRSANVSVGPMQRAWMSVDKLLASDKESSGWLRVERDGSNNLILRVRGVKAVGKNWRVPTLHIDASLDARMLRFFWPNFNECDAIEVDAPHAQIYQTTDKSFAKSHLEPLFGPITNPEGHAVEEARAKSRQRVKTFISKIHRSRGGDSFVIGNKRVVKAMGLETLPGVEMGHYNAICGRDTWGQARSGFIIGRTQPPASEVERIAEALTGDVIVPVGSQYPLRDGTRLFRIGDQIVGKPCEVQYHPNDIADRVRRRICNEEVYQALERSRRVNRTSTNPVSLYVLTNVALDIPIDGEIDSDEIRFPSPADQMLAEGGIYFESPTCAVKAYPQLWASPKALGMVLARQRKVEAEKGMQSAIRVTSSYNNSYIGQCYSVPAPAPSILTAPQGLIRVGFQRLGPKLHGEVAYYDPRRVENARASIEELVGPLAWYEEFEAKPSDDEASIIHPKDDPCLVSVKPASKEYNGSAITKINGSEAAVCYCEEISDNASTVPSIIDLLASPTSLEAERVPLLGTRRVCFTCGDYHAPFGEGWYLGKSENSRWYCAGCVPKNAIASYQDYKK